MRSGRRENTRVAMREVAWAAGIALVVLAPYLVVLATGHEVAWSDSVRLLAPTRSLVVEALRAGRLPLWNPYEGLGMPLFAQGFHFVLHPFSVLAAFVAHGDGVDLLILLSTASAAIGAATLSRTLGVCRSAAAVAGIGFGLSGYVLSMARVMNFLVAAGTAPWAIAGIVVAARGRGRLVLAAFAVAALHLAGDPQWTIVAVSLGFLLAWSQAGRRGLAGAVGAVALGTLLGAVQLVPSWAFFLQSARTDGIPGADRVEWALAPIRILELVAPGFFGGVPGPLAPPVYLWLGEPVRYTLPFVHGIAVGAPLFLLAGLGAVDRRRGRPLAVAGIVLLWAALGYHMGAAEALGRVPVLGAIRYAEKWVGPFSLVLAILAGIGAERAADPIVALRAGRVFLGTGAVFLVGAAAAFVLRDTAPAGVAVSDWAAATRNLSLGLAHAALGALTSGALLRAAQAGLRARWIGSGLVAVVSLSSLSAAPFAIHAGEPGVRASTPLAALHQATPVPRILTPLEAVPGAVPPGLEGIDAATWAMSRTAAASYNVPARVDQMSTYTGIEPRRTTTVFRRLLELGAGQLPALRRFSVTHVVIPAGLRGEEEVAVRDAATAGGERVGVDAVARLEVWAVPHRPWASFAGEATPATTEDQALSLLLESIRSGRGDVVIQGTPSVKPSPGEILRVMREPGRIEVEAVSPGDGLLVVNDAHWPGWQATIDGRPAEILLADGLVRAVAWPPGRHVVEMVYRPGEVAVGAWLAVLGLVIALGLLLTGRRTGEEARSAI